MFAEDEGAFATGIENYEIMESPASNVYGCTVNLGHARVR